jgi:hypothetical protein
MAKQKSQALPASEAAAGPAAAADASVTEVASAEEAAVATAPDSDPAAGPDGVSAEAAADSSAVADGAAAAPGAETVADPVQPQGQDEQPPTTHLPPGKKVRGLVLSDNAFGRCGEVREFEAAHAAVIEAGGFIDTHPNAVASAEGD